MGKDSKIILTIGFVNWIIVIILIPIVFLYNIGEYYLRISFLPALISIMYTTKVDFRFRTYNLVFNIIFLLLYTSVYLIMSFLNNNIFPHAT